MDKIYYKSDKIKQVLFIDIMNHVLIFFQIIMQIKIQEVNSNSQQESYFFEAVPNKFMNDKQTKQILMKWGLQQTFVLSSFRFNQKYDELNTNKFLVDLFNNPNVRYLLPAILFKKQNISQVKFQKLRCTETTLDLFDKLAENKLITKEYIQKTYGEQHEGIQICDLIRESLLKQQSQYYCVWNEKQRSELLLRVFQILLIGGSLNQYEDLITPYLDWTKKLYKSLVTVRKDAQTSDIFIQSFAFSINKIDKIYEKGYNPQELLYVIVNPSSRTVNIIHNRWVKFW